MRGIAALLITTIVSMLLASCGGGGGMASENRSNRGYNPGVGPFDSRGNYVESWADDKSKGRWWRKSRSTPSAVASTKPEPKPPVVASNPTPRPAPRSSIASRPRPRPPVGLPSRPTRSPAVASRPKPKPKKPVVRAKPKRKAPIRHTIKKGDTLYGLSRKYKTSVSAIQKANGLKGTNLRIGKRLLIPRY